MAGQIGDTLANGLYMASHVSNWRAKNEVRVFLTFVHDKLPSADSNPHVFVIPDMFIDFERYPGLEILEGSMARAGDVLLTYDTFRGLNIAQLEVIEGCNSDMILDTLMAVQACQDFLPMEVLTRLFLRDKPFSVPMRSGRSEDCFYEPTETSLMSDDEHIYGVIHYEFGKGPQFYVHHGLVSGEENMYSIGRKFLYKKSVTDTCCAKHLLASAFILPKEVSELDWGYYSKNMPLEEVKPPLMGLVFRCGLKVIDPKSKVQDIMMGPSVKMEKCTCENHALSSSAEVIAEAVETSDGSLNGEEVDRFVLLFNQKNDVERIESRMNNALEDYSDSSYDSED